MISKEIASKILSECLKTGGDFAEIFEEDSISNSIKLLDNKVENALGGSQAISNTSGVALQIVNMPLIEKTRVKRLSSKKGIENINKLILLIAKREGLLEIPEGMKPRDFYNTEVTFLDTLPKDQLIELQQIEAEMRLGIESRNGAMERLGKSPKKVLMELEEDFENNPEYIPFGFFNTKSKISASVVKSNSTLNSENR